jgi:hypothetical protein
MYDPEQITFFAKTDARGQEVPFGIKANDRTRHVYVIGKTGMGKSTLLENMAVQDIKNGNGLAFIDPHGQTAETLLDYIPESRKDDVVYFAPFDTANPVSFNVMEDVGEDQRHLVVSGLMSVFKKIWVDAWSARMEYILSNTLLALLEYPDSTLLGVNRMLSDKDYRMRVIENITDPAVKSFWVDEFLKYNERYMQEAGDAIKNKIGQFTSNPLIRNIIGQPHSSFDIRQIMDDKKILIMNLSKGLVGDQNANLLGSMLTTRIYLAAMSRANLTASEMKLAPNFYFYVDEFQSFANATFADILSEARKYKLNLTIAHQYIEQMEEEVRNAVFGNVGTIISFRVGPFDAEVLETVYTPTFLAPDIVNLGFAQIYLTLMIDGIGSAPFSAKTLPPIEPSSVSCKEIVIARSRELYTKQREGVETTIHDWHAKSFSNKPPYIPKHLREVADGGTLPNTGENLKKYGQKGAPEKKVGNKNQENNNQSEKDNTEKKEKFVPYKERMAQKKKLEEANAKKSKEEKPKGKVTENSDAKKEEEKSDSVKPSYTKESEINPDREVKKSTKYSDTKEPEAKADKETKEDHVPYKERMKKKGKNLEDLRSVLQDISSEKVRPVQSNGYKEKTTNKNESSLKDVLAAALVQADDKNLSEIKENQDSQNNNLSHKNQGKQNDSVPENKKKQFKKKEEYTQKQQVIKEVHRTHTASSSEQIEYAQMKNIDDPLSVKKLERMMRVTTSDKPPIK